MAISETKLNQKICAVISAAGRSSRMGSFKPLLPFGGCSIAACCIRALRKAGVDEVVLVTGHRGELLREALAGENLIFAENPDFATTEMFDSLKIGFAALPGDCTRVLIQPVDMPAISAETIHALLATSAPIVRPRCGGKGGHPLVLDAALLPRIMAHNGTDEDLAPRVAHYFAEAEKRDIPCLWWEDYFTGNTAVQYWLYDKSAQEWGRPQILQTIKNTLGITETSTTVKVSVNGTKHSFTTPYSEECTVYAAVYDESGKLLGITARSFDGSAVDLSLTIQNLPRTYSVKAFLLDTESYCPLAAVPE